jgi:glycosyltransferase involved in cell wall biosynthesis
MDIICYCHLRWNFVYQRPQHILSRLRNQYRIFFVEEPVFDADTPHLNTYENPEKIWVITPHLMQGTSPESIGRTVKELLNELWKFFDVKNHIAWYYTPMALEYSTGKPKLIVYDCMDELSAFKNAPLILKQHEKSLLTKAGIVFTGGYSLYEAKKNQHTDIHLFPSSIDCKHFEKARFLQPELHDQRSIPYPRIGFFGVIDERLDITLLNELAIQKPGWQFIMIGPVVKIDPDTLPAHPNIHYLGQKTYKELPWYIASWNAAMMPFAINESTRYISPTKTPEYLAAGKPVISTPIHDVVKAYGSKKLAYIAETPEQFIQGIQTALDMNDKTAWYKKVNEELAGNSWDMTCEKMSILIKAHLGKNKTADTKEKEAEYV